MKIAVCIKRVLDMESRFRIGADKASIDETGLKSDISDFDLYAIEAALQLREKAGQGEVVVVSLGPDAAQETIRKALSMGADRGVLLRTDRIPFDAFAIATALAAELGNAGYDVILFGKLSIDSANQATGPIVAELLDLPCVTAISKLDITDAKGTARRDLEGASEIVEFPLPAVLTIDEGMNKPRLPSLKGIMGAKKKPIEVKPATPGESRVTVATMELPPERSGGRIIGEGVAAVPELVRLLETEAKVL